MKLRRSVQLTTVALLIVIGIASCSRRIPPPAPPPPAPPPPVTAPAPPPPPPPPPQPAPAPAPQRPLTEDEIFSQKSLDQLNQEMPLGDMYFDYDQASIRDDARAVLQRNAEFLKRWPSTRIRVEGHTDSRGTNEYNLGLGERRAAAVRDYLVSLGIMADRMLTVSRGEETPQCTEETEACWQRNRRGHFVFTAK